MPVEMPQLCCKNATQPSRSTCRVSVETHSSAACLLWVCAAVLLELTELAKPIEMPCLCCKTTRTRAALQLVHISTYKHHDTFTEARTPSQRAARPASVVQLPTRMQRCSSAEWRASAGSSVSKPPSRR